LARQDCTKVPGSEILGQALYTLPGLNEHPLFGLQVADLPGNRNPIVFRPRSLEYLLKRSEILRQFNLAWNHNGVPQCGVCDAQLRGCLEAGGQVDRHAGTHKLLKLILFNSFASYGLNVPFEDLHLCAAALNRPVIQSRAGTSGHAASKL